VSVVKLEGRFVSFNGMFGWRERKRKERKLWNLMHELGLYKL
jgi:hypothetical protein